MSTIKYILTGTYPPFSVELREDSKIGTVVDSMVAPLANTEYSFSGVTGTGTFVIVAYDSMFGIDNDATVVT